VKQLFDAHGLNLISSLRTASRSNAAPILLRRSGSISVTIMMARNARLEREFGQCRGSKDCRWLTAPTKN
jgi:hypothetical protein